uniref:immunoglobulin superfamily member 23 isoform X4 n=1 Tax=Callithrix jacchus TaxID=9483 RepID=UPI0023DD3558|nr:immunoglobulin superfamily member 23 isoform X4 [Callithrix jacchus]XP_054106011.1 immunoglobulin superfamily member 23 isoform X4 [Callithrix jacchus]XP_054106012.1 immunoglobulin superfamily member 23 isoform X4 [Callithrix jacchus]
MRAKPQGLLPRNPVPLWSPPTTTIDPVLEKDATRGDFPANSKSHMGTWPGWAWSLWPGSCRAGPKLQTRLRRSIKTPRVMKRPSPHSPWTEYEMRSPLDVSSGHTPAWRKLLLTGRREVRRKEGTRSPTQDLRTGKRQDQNSGPQPSPLPPGILLTSCTCSAFSELPFSTQLNTWTEGASVHLPVPGSLDGILTTSWFRGHDAQPAAMIFSPEGLPGPAHTGREMLGTQGSLVIRNVTALDSGSYTVVLETSRGHRSVTEQIHVKNSFPLPQLKTFPGAFQGVIQTELNYSVILQWMVIMNPEPVVSWTLNGVPCGIGERLFIRRLSMEQLGTYMCTATNSKEQLVSAPVTISLPTHRTRAHGARPHSVPVRRCCHFAHRGWNPGSWGADWRLVFHHHPEPKSDQALRIPREETVESPCPHGTCILVADTVRKHSEQVKYTQRRISSCNVGNSPVS